MQLNRSTYLTFAVLLVCCSCSTVAKQEDKNVWENINDDQVYTVRFTDPYNRDKYTVYDPEGSLDSENIGINYLMTQIDVFIPNIVTQLSIVPPSALSFLDVHGEVKEDEKNQIILEVIAQGIKYHVDWIDCIAEHKIASGQICKYIEIAFSAASNEDGPEITYLVRFHSSYECNGGDEYYYNISK